MPGAGFVRDVTLYGALVSEEIMKSLTDSSLPSALVTIHGSPGWIMRAASVDPVFDKPQPKTSLPHL